MRIEILLFLTLMVMTIVMIACSVPRRPSPSLPPTLFAGMSLATYDPQMITRVGGDASIAATISPPKARHRDTSISPPHCYHTASPMLTCLGAIRNLGQRAISDIVLKASLFAPDGRSIFQRNFSPEQRRVAAGSSAGYRLLIPRTSDDAVAIEIGLVDARFAAPEGVKLVIDDERGAYLAEQKQYRYTGVVRNISGQMARDIRLIVTLESRAGAVVGYRALDLSHQLPDGGDINVDILIATLGAQAPVRHQASLEALPLAQP